MKTIILSMGVALSLLAGPAFAAEGAATAIDVSNLTQEQLDSLVSILSGLPRQ